MQLFYLFIIYICVISGVSGDGNGDLRHEKLALHPVLGDPAQALAGHLQTGHTAGRTGKIKVESYMLERRAKMKASLALSCPELAKFDLSNLTFFFLEIFVM
jgi:hypothetical protein